MNIQKRLQIEFEFVGEEQISGNTALKIVNDVFKDAQTNQILIEELEKLQIHHKGEHFGCGRVYFIKEDSIDGRIKELKQER